jgi:FkbM family methyltransferase
LPRPWPLTLLPRWRPFRRKRPATPPQPADHSQFGELALLRPHLPGRVRHRIVVDVGANSKVGSNSYDLMRDDGWKGILIEANPALWPRIEEDFAGLDFTLLRTAVSDAPGEHTLYLSVNDGISSFFTAKVESFGPVTGSVQVTSRRLHELLAEQGVPLDFDLLTIDIEWMDLPVLNDLLRASAYRPGFIITEMAKEGSVQTLDDLDCDEAPSRRNCRQTLRTP